MCTTYPLWEHRRGVCRYKNVELDLFEFEATHVMYSGSMRIKGEDITAAELPISENIVGILL